WGPHLGVPAAYRWCARYAACRRLYPLWRALYHAAPHIALDPPASALGDATHVADVSFQLCRRVIEIRDGCLEMRRYADPAIAVAARAEAARAGLAGDDADAFVEAACLAAALRAHATGQPVAHEVAVPATGGGADDVDGEAGFLCRVAAFVGSPLLRQVLATP